MVYLKVAPRFVYPNLLTIPQLVPLLVNVMLSVIMYARHGQKMVGTWDIAQLPWNNSTVKILLLVEKEKNVWLQEDQNMESVSLNLILLESTVQVLKIVNGINWKHAMIRVNVSNVTTKSLMNKRVLQKKSEHQERLRECLRNLCVFSVVNRHQLITVRELQRPLKGLHVPCSLQRKAKKATLLCFSRGGVTWLYHK